MIGIDWGSSGFRAYRIADDGRILDRRNAACGITSLQSGDYPAVLRREVGDWFEQDDGALILSGMVGSRQGWREAAYVQCPARLADLPAHLCRIPLGDGREALIVPGLACRTAQSAPDVMRGEEIQIFGAVAPDEDVHLCLPGTHSKHVVVRAGRIVSFVTAMTGEVFALLRQHGLLAAMLAEEQGPFDEKAFVAGLERAAEPGGLLHHLFGLRGHRLFDEITAAAAPDYLSGLLIGHELQGTEWEGQVRILGTRDLAARYRRAFRHFGIASTVGPEHAAAQGLYRLACLLAGGSA